MVYPKLVEQAIYSLIDNHRAEFEVTLENLCALNGLEFDENLIPNFEAHLAKVITKQKKAKLKDEQNTGRISERTES